MKQDEQKPWTGRFTEETHKIVEDFTCSVNFDKRLYKEDIAGSKAHALMLAKQAIITGEEASIIIQNLDEIQKDIESGEFEWREELEDVHMNIEYALTEKIGSIGKKLHTARSRNDQVTTDFRLCIKNETKNIELFLHELQRAFVHSAEKYPDLIIPGYTHLQRAQPVLWAHHMLAYFEMFKRDRERLTDCLKRVNVSPLGSCALGGTGFPIDREYTAMLLGFRDITQNSIDGVSDRDFVIEFLGCLSIIMVHLSRLSEELIMWSSSEFSFIDLPDSVCTGSSIMPQKKNPDVPELVRGKTGRVIGHLMAMLTTIKALPLSYNRDMQEDKEAVFDAVDTVKRSIEVMTIVVDQMKPLVTCIKNSLKMGYLTATDLADYLVRKGLPFRHAHMVAGKVVYYGIQELKDLNEMSLEELKGICKEIEEDVFNYITLEGSINIKKSAGSTSPELVKNAITQAYKWLDKNKGNEI